MYCTIGQAGGRRPQRPDREVLQRHDQPRGHPAQSPHVQTLLPQLSPW